MDDELKQALGAIENRFVAIDNRFVAMDNRLVEMESRMAERIHDTETKLLKAFYDWASPADARINKALPALDERLGWVEQRVTALERRNLEQGI